MAFLLLLLMMNIYIIIIFIYPIPSPHPGWPPLQPSPAVCPRTVNPNVHLYPKSCTCCCCCCCCCCCLQGLTFAVFGLGNKQYEHFNAVGKKMFKCLKDLGAQPLLPRGDGDDDGCIDDEFDKWWAYTTN